MPSIGDLIALLALLLAGYSLYLQYRKREDPPIFEMKLSPPPTSGTNPLLEIACVGGSLTYAIEAEILGGPEVPAAIALISEDAEQVGHLSQEGVFRRYSLGNIRHGERRAYSIQPDPGIGGRQDNRASLRLTATTTVRRRALSWQSTYVLPLKYKRSGSDPIKPTCDT